MDDQNKRQDNHNSDTNINPAPPSSDDKGKTLGVVGLILSLIGAGVFGVVLGVIGLKQSKKSGHKNKIALSAIVVGAVTMIGSIVLFFTVILPKTEVFIECSKTSSNSVVIDSKIYNCSSLEQTSSSLYQSSNSSSQNQSVKDIVGTSVSLSENTVNSECFSYEAPTDYILYPNAASCVSAIRLGSSLLNQITVQAQTGSDTIETFYTKIENIAQQTNPDSFKKQDVTIGGQRAGLAYAENSAKLLQAFYFIPDSYRKFSSNGSLITSYLISGPAYNPSLSVTIESVAASFRQK